MTSVAEKPIEPGQHRFALRGAIDDRVSGGNFIGRFRRIDGGARVAYPAAPAGDGPDPQEALRELNRLAQVTGGRVFRLPNEQALPGVLDDIVADLRAQYVLGFAPDSTGPPGRLRKISVKVRPRSM